MAGEIAEAFETHLRSLSDDEWNALTARVRTSAAPPPPQSPLPGETGFRTDPGFIGTKTGIAAGLAEAKRRGFIDADGKPVKR